MEKLFPVWRLSRLYILVPILESLPTYFLDLCQIAGVPAPPVNANLQPLCDESHFPAATSVWWSPGGKSTALSSALALAAGRGCACQLGLSALLDIHNHQSHLNKIVITFNRYNIVVFTKPRAPTFAPQPLFFDIVSHCCQHCCWWLICLFLPATKMQPCCLFSPSTINQLLLFQSLVIAHGMAFFSLPTA